MIEATVGYYVETMLPCPNCNGEALLIEVPFNDGDIWYHPECSCCNIGWQENYPTIEDAVNAWNGSRVETKPVVHGRWIFSKAPDGSTERMCSECDDTVSGRFPTTYCANCGAKMDLEQEIIDE